MKKMKIFGLLAAVVSLSGCSLGADVVTRGDFKKLFDDNILNTKITDWSSVKKKASLKFTNRVIGEEEVGEYSGNKFTTSDTTELTYSIINEDYALFKDVTGTTLLKSEDKAVVSISVQSLIYHYQEVKDAAESIFKRDVAIDGSKVLYELAYTPTMVNDQRHYNATYRKVEYGWDAKKGAIKTTGTPTQLVTPVINKPVEDEAAKQQLAEMIADFFVNVEIDQHFQTVKGEYNLSVDYVESTCDDNHELEIFLRNGNYIYRCKEDKMITEINVVSHAAEEAAQSSAATSAESTEESAESAESEETSEEAASARAFRIKSVVRREGFEGKEIKTLTFTNL